MDNSRLKELKSLHGETLRAHAEDLSKWDLATARKSCRDCNGTGVLKQETIFGSNDIVTIVCHCVERKKGTEK